MILDRPGEKQFVDKAREDDMAIMVDTKLGLRRSPFELHKYLAHGNGIWEEFEHNDELMAALLALPERKAEA